MYQPAHFREDRLDVQHDLIRGDPLGLLVSAGADGALGMERPNSITSTSSHLGLVTSAEELGDNLSNRQKGPK